MFLKKFPTIDLIFPDNFPDYNSLYQCNVVNGISVMETKNCSHYNNICFNVEEFGFNFVAFALDTFVLFEIKFIYLKQCYRLR